ncbi:PA14 domain-containing protein [Pseudocitrobacter cyperus]|uniref:Uncharacterized protein n=1 Tax=Pseudocitrobacter cyperus TaxID=3112843 RepID=A0ABV0HP51_9ENTR
MRFTVSAPHDERFAEFYTGEALDASTEYLFADDARPEQTSFCRRVFCHDFSRRTVSPGRALPSSQTVQADESGMVHFSVFKPVAIHSQRWLRVDLHVAQSGEYPFQLATCGGVRIWIDGKEAACFTPFTRNTLQICQVRLPLQQGENSLLIHLEELCERQTQFVLRMIYQGQAPLETSLNAQDEALPPFMQPCAEVREDEGDLLLNLLKQGQGGEQAESLLVRLLQRVSAREEASSYALVSLLWVWHGYRGEIFPPALWRRVRSAVLGYRYWFDELGNDVMWFVGVNNALSFHTAQYLAGQMFSEERFTASGRLGREQQEIAAQRLAYWSANVSLQKGAAPGLLALSHLADDAGLRARAQRLLIALTASDTPFSISHSGAA